MRQVTRKGLITVAAASGVLAARAAATPTPTPARPAPPPDSPGVLSGNTVQAPVHVPVNVCGNTVNVVGLLNPASGNGCANDRRRPTRSRTTRGSARRARAGSSPGVGSGNHVQAPVHVPVNVCGNSVDVLGTGNAPATAAATAARQRRRRPRARRQTPDEARATPGEPGHPGPVDTRSQPARQPGEPHPAGPAAPTPAHPGRSAAPAAPDAAGRHSAAPRPQAGELGAHRQRAGRRHSAASPAAARACCSAGVRATAVGDRALAACPRTAGTDSAERATHSRGPLRVLRARLPGRSPGGAHLADDPPAQPHPAAAVAAAGSGGPTPSARTRHGRSADVSPPCGRPRAARTRRQIRIPASHLLCGQRPWYG